MKNQKIIRLLAIVGLVTLSGYGLYQLGMKQRMKMSNPMADSMGAAAAMAKEEGADKKVLYWHDPMVPSQKFDKPGKSPFMDMQLVAVYADGGGDDGKVSISPRVQQNLGIRTAEVTKGDLSSNVVSVGSVAYNERDVALVQARSNGFVEKLYVRAPLDTVRKGQALAELYVPDWVAVQEEYLSARHLQVVGMEGVLDGAKQRMRLAGMNDDQIRIIETSGKVHPRITITAPIGGVIAELSVREGMTVATGAPLFRINGIGTIWVNAEIPENLSAQVRPGNTVEARTPSLPGTVFKGKVGAILPQVDMTTRTLKARIELANPSGQLVPGMFATLNFNSAARKDILLVPTEAVITTGTRSVVMVAQGDGKVWPVDVEIGMETNGQTEIRKGLDAGQKVVVSGQFLIDSEASLKGTATRMGESAASDNGKATGMSHRGEGKVEKIDKDDITISHGPIPALQWGPMTMGFKLPAGGLPRNVEVGDTVIFEIRAVKEGVFQITTITPTVAVPMSDMPDKAMKNMPDNMKADAMGKMKMPAVPTGEKK
jgi:Cu(I)/Ag(I) efflux system membrane fusion protein